MFARFKEIFTTEDTNFYDATTYLKTGGIATHAALGDQHVKVIDGHFHISIKYGDETRYQPYTPTVDDVSTLAWKLL